MRFLEAWNEVPIGLAALGIALCLAAPVARGGEAPQRTRDEAGMIKPDLIYHNYCSVCHGDRGDGRSRARNALVPPPKDFTTPAALEQMNRDAMVLITTHGKRGTAMVGWSTQLTKAEIEAVVDYIIGAFMTPRLQPAFARGRALYAQSCSACHGENGQGALVATGSGPPPRNFATVQAREGLSREQMIAAVTQGKPGTAMASFSKQLAPADIEAVVDYVRVAYMGGAIAGVSGTAAHGGRARSRASGPPGQ